MRLKTEVDKFSFQETFMHLQMNNKLQWVIMCLTWRGDLAFGGITEMLPPADTRQMVSSCTNPLLF